MAEQNHFSCSYEYPRPAVATDSVVFGYSGLSLRVLLIKRKIEPFKDCLALPGGFVGENESADEGAKRELKEETGLELKELHQFHTFSAVDRDPRGRVIAIAYFGLVKECRVVGGTDASSADWYDLDFVPVDSTDSSVVSPRVVDQNGQVLTLAFDHQEILEEAYKSLQKFIYFYPIGFDLLPKYFTMAQLQRLYEQILNKTFDRRNFISKMVKKTKIVQPVEEELDPSEMEFAISSSRITPRKVYYFNRECYEQLSKSKTVKMEF